MMWLWLGYCWPQAAVTTLLARSIHRNDDNRRIWSLTKTRYKMRQRLTSKHSSPLLIAFDFGSLLWLLSIQRLWYPVLFQNLHRLVVPNRAFVESQHI